MKRTLINSGKALLFSSSFSNCHAVLAFAFLLREKAAVLKFIIVKHCLWGGGQGVAMEEVANEQNKFPAYLHF